MAHYDCLLIGHNELDFQQYYNILDNMASSGGRDHVAFTDLQLNSVDYKRKPYQGEDLLSLFYNEGRPDVEHRFFYNGDCLWTAIAYLGTYLAKRGYTFDYVNLVHREKETLKRKLQTNHYEVIALTGTMYVFEQNIYELVSFIRKCGTTARIVAGGPYISKQAEEREPEYLKPLFRYLNADIYCYAREGEQTLVKVIDAVKNKADLSTINNIAYKNGREFVVTPLQRENNPLAANMIDYSLFRDAYAGTGWANVRVSDGCPYACAFCAFPEHNNERYETMSIARIEQELDAIRDAGAISHIFFIDATLNVPRGHFTEMLRMMIRNNYGFKWHSFFRCDQTDEQTVDLMREAGCIGVFLGLESASDIVLRNMDKTAHKKDFRRAVPWLKRAGIRQMLSMQVGFPGETYATFRETLDFLEEINPDFTRPQIWFCDPTTPVWRRRSEFNLQGKAYGWSHYTMDAETAVELVVETFMSHKNPTWIPDPGYNWVFLYAMEKIGMSIEQQKTFLRFFAAAAKEKLLKPNRLEISPGLLDGLRTSAQFDRPGAPDLTALEPYSAERYIAAETFWVDLFRTSVARGHRADDRLEPDPEHQPAQGTDNGSFLARTAVPGGLAFEGALRETLLAAYAVLLASIDGREDSPVLIAVDEDEPFPLPLAARSELTFEELVRATGEQLRQAEAHRLFALFLLTNPRRMAEHGIASPSIRASFLVTVSTAASTQVLKQRLQHRPKVYDTLDLLLTCTTTPGSEPHLELSSPTGRYGKAHLERLASRLSAVLEVACKNQSESVDVLRRLVGVTESYQAIDVRPSPGAPPAEHRRGEYRLLPLLDVSAAG